MIESHGRHQPHPESNSPDPHMQNNHIPVNKSERTIDLDSCCTACKFPARLENIRSSQHASLRLHDNQGSVSKSKHPTIRFTTSLRSEPKLMKSELVVGEHNSLLTKAWPNT